MKILLVGEYSRLHNSLKEGLVALGHQVTIIATGDYWKNYPADIKLKRTYDQGLGKKLKVGVYKLFNIDITSLDLRRQFYSQKENLEGYDVVQLINESPFGLTPAIEMELIGFLKKHNKKLFLLSCGTDYLSVKYQLSDALPYSIMSELKNGSASKEDFRFILKYTKERYRQLHEFVYGQINGVIASDLDYHLPLKDHPSYLGLIPNPVNTDKIADSQPQPEGRINIFLGINRSAYHTKGIRYFDEALEKISAKYGDSISIEVVENLPYDTYIEKYNKAHILLDQVLGCDQGYNALEAMAKGKVVFTGAETIFTEYYKLEKPVAINALPDSEAIAAELERLILNPRLIAEIGANAREFILQHHQYQKVAESYVNLWNRN